MTHRRLCQHQPPARPYCLCTRRVTQPVSRAALRAESSPQAAPDGSSATAPCSPGPGLPWPESPHGGRLEVWVTSTLIDSSPLTSNTGHFVTQAEQENKSGGQEKGEVKARVKQEEVEEGQD